MKRGRLVEQLLRSGLLAAGVLLALSGDIQGLDQRPQAEAHAEQGLKSAQAGDFERAETELRQAVELAPNDPKFLAALGTVLAMENKLEESTRILQKALKLAPNDLTVRRYVAANLWQLHRYPEAKQNLEIILKAKPGDAPSRLLMGMVAENTGDYATAAKMLASVPEQVRQRPESIVALARSYYHLGQTDKARTTLAELSTQPAGPQAIVLGAQIADEMRDYDTAEKMLAGIQSTFPNPPALAYRLALVQFHAQRFSDSQRTLLNLTQAGNAASAVYNLLGWCYQQQNQPGEAVQALEQSIGMAPQEEANYLDLARILLAQHRLPAALDAAKRTTVAFPSSARAFELRGQTETAMAQFADAVASYEHATQLDPSRPDALLGLAQAQFASGMRQQATASFEAGTKRFPKHARLRVGYASMLLKEAESGDTLAEGHTERLLQSALALDPALPEAHYLLGNLALKKGNMPEALQHLQSAVKLDPQSSAAHFALSRAYRRLGRKEEASREMTRYEKLKSTERQPESSTALDGKSPD